jgi:small GTP-binding protein
MIHNVFILTTTGQRVFHRQYWSIDVTNEVIQEFLVTLSALQGEIGPNVDLPIHVSQIKFLYSAIGDQLLLAFAVDSGDDEASIKELIKRTQQLLLGKYRHEVESYLTNPEQKSFEGFASELDDVIVTMLKICLLGQGGVGKSTMLKLLTGAAIDGIYVPTVAVDVEKLQGVRFGPYELVVWDFAGQERFRSLWGYYLRNADAVLLVTDSTLKNVLATRDILEVVRKNASSAIVWAIANKQDLPGALSAKLVQRILGVQTYGLVAIDPRYREVLFKVLVGAVAEATSD